MFTWLIVFRIILLITTQSYYVDMKNRPAWCEPLITLPGVVAQKPILFLFVCLFDDLLLRSAWRSLKLCYRYCSQIIILCVDNPIRCIASFVLARG